MTAWHERRMLLITTTLLLFLHWRTATADYFLNFELIDFTSPTNLIATGMCCNEAEEVGSCVTECDVLINICIRPSNSELPRDMSNCPILNQIVVQSNTNEILSPWPGGVQLLMFAIEGDGTFVDTFEVEHTATAAQSGEQVTTVELTVLTDHSILMVSVSIQCVFGFHGPNCDCEDTDDSTGHFTCTATGERECLEGYQNPDTNCVECVTAQGCSDMGGFCEQPGDCFCLDGYAGDNCDTLVTTAVEVPSSSLESFQAVSPSSSFRAHQSVMMSPSAESSLIASTRPVLHTTITPSASESPTMIAGPSTISKVASSLSPSPIPSSNQGRPFTTSTPAPQTTFQVSSSNPVPSSPVFSSRAISPSPSLSSASPAISSTVIQTTTVELSSSQTTVELSSSQTTVELSSSQTTVELSSSQTTVALSSSALMQTTVALSSSEMTTVQTLTPPPLSSSTVVSTVVTSQPQSTTVTSLQSSSQMDTTFIVNPPSPTTAPPPVSTSTPSSSSPSTVGTPMPGPSSGNVVVIAGTAVAIFVVVVLVIMTIPCVYLIMKRRRRYSIKNEMIFLDQVYNAPVTFVNPEHEGVSPRSPQLFTPGEGGQRKSGNRKEVSHKSHLHPGAGPTVPYAEAGPGSDHAVSPDDQPLESTEATIIANPNSWSQHSESPQPSTPIIPSSNPNRRSGLGFDYKDDPIGDANLSVDTEQPRYSSAPESSAEAVSSSRSVKPPILPRRRNPPVRPGAARGTTVEEGGLVDEEEVVKKRASDYLQAAGEEGEKRQSAMKDIVFTDIHLDMTTQTEL